MRSPFKAASLTLMLGAMCCVPIEARNSAEAGEIDFNRDIRPILSNNCFRCHGPDDAQREADLRLDTYEGATAELASGRALVPHQTAESALVSRIRSTDPDRQMPPPSSELTLSAKQIDLLEKWISEGGEYQAHWAFQPLSNPETPTITRVAGTPIDAFVLEELERRNLMPSPLAPRGVLIRRMTFDLLGLPPAPEDVVQFNNDTRPDAVERLIDRLLASPRYGERWGRHWLDQARYADTNGYTVDSDRTIWPFRDWVINSLNADMPFDQFTVEQLAGDLLPTPTREQIVATGFHRNTLVNQEGGTDPEQFRNEAVVDRVNTTGAVWLGLTVGCAQCHNHKYDPISHREYYQLFAFFNSDEDINSIAPTISLATSTQLTDVATIDSQIRLIKNALQEHEAQSELLAPTGTNDAPITPVQSAGSVSAAQRTAQQTAAPTLTAPAQAAAKAATKPKSKKKKATTAKPVVTKVDPQAVAAADDTQPEVTWLRGELKRLEVRRKEMQGRIVSSMVLRQLAKPRDSFIHVRGDFLRHGEPVIPEVPAAVPPALDRASAQATRLDLARWLVSPDNPLVPRVVVNRAWSHFFTYGLVETENDFGIQGTTPTHAMLLDWLAGQLQTGGWSQKRLHRQIVSSDTYQQSSSARIDLLTADPTNKFLARQSRLRVEAEIVRDASLQVSSLIANQLCGPSVYPPQPDGVYAFTQNKSGWPTSKGAARYRRGIYTFFRRSAPYPMLTTFDTPRFDTTCTRRLRSNTPLQSLTLANDPAMLEMATALGARLWQHDSDFAGRVRYAFSICFAREPSSEELESVLQYWNQQRNQLSDDTQAAKQLLSTLKDQPGWPTLLSGNAEADGQRAAWVMVARVLMNLDEFVTRE